MSDAPILTEEMLEALGARWREQGAPIVESLRPGLDADALHAALAPIGVRLPAEARVWWGWHDGASQSLSSHAIGLDLIYLPVATAVARYDQERAGAAVAIDDGLDPEETWQPNWFPLSVSGDGAVMACDCAVAEGALTPIRYVHWDKAGKDSFVPVAPSLGTVVSWWIEVIDAGAWRFDKQHARWEAEPERLPDPALERTGLV